METYVAKKSGRNALRQACTRSIIRIILCGRTLRAISIVSTRLHFKKNRLYITVGVFHEDEAIQRVFESSVRAVNKERHENEELSNVYLIPEAFEVEMDPFEVSSKGKALII